MRKSVKRIGSGKQLTKRQHKEITTIAAMLDDEIDFSDIPPLPESFWQNAVRNPFYRPVKQQLTVRLDADIIAWLRMQGKGYQTRINHLLREAMLEDTMGRTNRKQ